MQRHCAKNDGLLQFEQRQAQEAHIFNNIINDKKCHY